jgi:hypothetical protein
LFFKAHGGNQPAVGFLIVDSPNNTDNAQHKPMQKRQTLAYYDKMSEINPEWARAFHGRAQSRRGRKENRKKVVVCSSLRLGVVN